MRGERAEAVFKFIADLHTRIEKFCKRDMWAMY